MVNGRDSLFLAVRGSLRKNLAPDSNTNQDGSTVVHCKVNENVSFLLLLEARRCNFLYFVFGSADSRQLTIWMELNICSKASKCCSTRKKETSPTRKFKSIHSEFQFEQQMKNYTRIAPTTNDLGAIETTKSLIGHIVTNALAISLK